MQSIKLEELERIYNLPSVLIVDVRPKAEFDQGHIPNSFNIPIDQLKESIASIPQDRSLYIVCEKGGQSIGATMILARHGVTACCVTSGGLKQWKAKGLPINIANSNTGFQNPIGGVRLD